MGLFDIGGPARPPGVGAEIAEQRERGDRQPALAERLRPQEERGPAAATVPPSPKPAPEAPEVVGTIYGNVGTSSFECRVSAHLERSEYVAVEHEDCGTVLCQVGSLVRKTDLSLERSADPCAEIGETVSAHVEVVGYRDGRGLLLTPRTTFRAGARVLRADAELVQSVLGLRVNPKTDAYIGLLHGHGLPVALNINGLLQRHACILAKSGGGKSFVAGDIVEELMKHYVTCVVIDPHGEYGSMRETGPGGDPRFGVVPRGYADRMLEFAVSGAGRDGVRPLRFTLRALEARELLELAGAGDARSSLPALRKAVDSLRERADGYSLQDLVGALADAGDPALVSELERLDRVGVFAARGNRVDEIVVEGKTTVVNLKGVPPDIQELVVRRLATILFEMRKAEGVPPLMLVVEEAHNFCPQQGSALSSRALATIASEGRKFGLGLTVISQRPAKIDKNVLSQCGTQIILKVTNPNDVKAIASSVEGMTAGMVEDMQTMPVGMALVVGAGIESPLLVEVRPRESRHGGAGVVVLEGDRDGGQGHRGEDRQVPRHNEAGAGQAVRRGAGPLLRQAPGGRLPDDGDLVLRGRAPLPRVRGPGDRLRRGQLRPRMAGLRRQDRPLGRGRGRHAVHALRTISGPSAREGHSITSASGPSASEASPADAVVNTLRPSMHMAERPVPESRRSARPTSGGSSPARSENRRDRRKSDSSDGARMYSSRSGGHAAAILDARAGSDSTLPVPSGAPTTASLRSKRSPVSTTLPAGGRPGETLTGWWPAPVRPDTSPRPPPPSTSATCAARNAVSLPAPETSQAHRAAARAPAADIPKPCPTGRPFSTVTSNPRPGAAAATAALVIGQSASRPSMVTRTAPSDLSSRWTVAPFDSLMPAPLDPVVAGSPVRTGWKKHVTCPGQKAVVMSSRSRGPGCCWLCPPWCR